MENNNEEREINSRVYEVGYLLLPTISEEEMPGVYTKLKDLVVSLGGEIISDEMPKMISLAYTMSKIIKNVRNKFDSAYFGWVKFQMEPEKVLELKKKLNLDLNLIRFLVLKTVKENTIATKRFMNRDFKKRISTVKKEGEEEISTPINKEEIDKEIDAMVAV